MLTEIVCTVRLHSEIAQWESANWSRPAAMSECGSIMLHPTAILESKPVF